MGKPSDKLKNTWKQIKVAKPHTDWTDSHDPGYVPVKEIALEAKKQAKLKKGY